GRHSFPLVQAFAACKTLLRRDSSESGRLCSNVRLFETLRREKVRPKRRSLASYPPAGLENWPGRQYTKRTGRPQGDAAPNHACKSGKRTNAAFAPGARLTTACAAP